MKYLIFIAILFCCSIPGYCQTSVISDPGTGTVSFTDLAGNALASNLLPINQPVYLRVPINNFNTFQEIPSGSIIAKTGLGSKLMLEPGFDLNNARLHEYFMWTTNLNNGQVEIIGDLLAALPPGFADTAIFMVRPYTLLSSSVTVNILVTNHASSLILSDENPTNNNTNRSYSIVKQNQTITFNAPPSKVYGSSSFSLTATASSGLPVSYTSSNTAVATVSGSTVTITGVGTTNITALQAGDGTYNAAPSIVQPFTVTQKTITITGAVAQNKSFDSTTAATINVSGASLVTLVGSDIVTVTGGGTFASSNAGTGIPVTTALVLGGPRAYNYILTQPSGLSADITPAAQTISFAPLPVKIVSDPPFTLAATSSSGLPVSYTSSNPLVATVTGNTVTIVATGSTIITASQPGDANYAAAAPVAQTLTVVNAITVNLKLYLQGYYAGSGSMQPVLLNQAVSSNAAETDTVIIELHDPSTFALISSIQAVLMTDGTVSAQYGLSSGNYYIAIRHRNTLYTWSADPVALSGSSPLYDFTTAASKAFGDNQILVAPGVYALYSGDTNQDEFIDGNDFPVYDTDSFIGVSSMYSNTDLNGDGFVDGNDFPVLDLNSFNGVSSIHP